MMKETNVFMAILLLVTFCCLGQGCKAGTSLIEPVLPGNQDNLENGSNPNDNPTSDYGNCGIARILSFKVTEPEEYLNSNLFPKAISSDKPEFTVQINGLNQPLSQYELQASIDGEYASASPNLQTYEVAIRSVKALCDGKHTVELKLISNGSLIGRGRIDFAVYTKPPVIQAVLWMDTEPSIVVLFDRKVEPNIVTNPSNWMINNESIFPRTDKIQILGNSMAKIRIDEMRYGAANSPKKFQISFADKNGTADFTIKPDPSDREVCSICLNCDTNPPSMTYNQSDQTYHDQIETERPAFAFELHRPQCIVAAMEWWTLVPINNLKPFTDDSGVNNTLYELSSDPLTAGPGINLSGTFFICDKEGINTISLDENYIHVFSLRFTAFCDEPETMYLGNIGLSFGGTNFDSVNPEFVHAPQILYGSEIPGVVNGWLSGIPRRDETPARNKRISTMTESELQGFLNGYTDLDNQCALFIVAETKDTNSGGRNGFTDHNYWFLDKKLKDGNIVFDKYIKGDMYIGISLDYYPWGSPLEGENPNPADDKYELAQWADPTYPVQAAYAPGIIGENWSSSEGEVLIIVVPDLENGGGDNEIVGMKLRIEDTAHDPTLQTYRGNWIRSNDLMPQFDDPVIKARFINDNPYDETTDWKIVKYDGNISDYTKETTFIYNRAEDGVADGRVKLDYYVLVDKEFPNDHIKPVKNIDVMFSSTETKFPPGCEQTVTLQAQGSLGSIPRGIDRLNELFVPVMSTDCLKYYHIELTVSDSDFTTEANKILFVSSNDMLLQGDDILDYSTSYATAFEQRRALEDFSFGTKRGTGTSNPFPYIKEWYSYDEFITNGGIEIVYASINHFFDDLEYQFVPVQSESDLMVIDSHGSHERIMDSIPNSCTKVYEDYLYASEFTYPNKIYDPIRPGGVWSRNASKFVANNVPGIGGYCYNSICSDFSDYGNIGWKDFWLKENGELRWLVLDACSLVKKTSPTDLRENWKQIILDNYLSSVCGFRLGMSTSKTHMKLYGDYLKRLYAIAGGYDSSSEICIHGHESFYVVNRGDDWKWNASKDPSVAAWMESAANGFKYSKYRRQWAEHGIMWASAINDEIPSSLYAYFYLKPIRTKKPANIFELEEAEWHYCKHKIKKEYF